MRPATRTRPVTPGSTGAQRATAAVRPDRRMRRTGEVLSVLVVLFLLMDATMKLLELPVVLDVTAQLGWPTGTVIPLGIILLMGCALYAFPRTSVLAAILLTAYLGGAIATHVRIGSPLFSHVLFGVYVAIVMWGGLWLRDERLRALLPFAPRAHPGRADRT